MGDSTMTLLLLSTATVAIVHTLAPDHWIPFVGMGRARDWSVSKVLWVTVAGGIAHVGSSVLIGALGMMLGFSLTSLTGLESGRGQIAGLLLIGFGIAYAIWGWKKMHSHTHAHSHEGNPMAIWGLIAIFVLGPCEPLIPLMFVSAAHGVTAVVAVTALFSLLTVFMMIAQVRIAYLGIDVLGFTKRMNHHHGHIAAGLVIAGTGAFVMLLGI